jgi:hypothetical protein
MTVKRTIVIAVEVDVDAFEDASGLTPDELARKVCQLVEVERNELAAEARIAALKLLAGERVGPESPPPEDGAS